MRKFRRSGSPIMVASRSSGGIKYAYVDPELSASDEGGWRAKHSPSVENLNSPGGLGLSIFKKFAAPLLAVALVAVMGVSLLTNTRTAYAATAVTAWAPAAGLGPLNSPTTLIPAWSGGTALTNITFNLAAGDQWGATTIVLTGPVGTTWTTSATTCTILVVATGLADATATCSAASVNNVLTVTGVGVNATAASRVTITPIIKVPNGTASGGVVALTGTALGANGFSAAIPVYATLAQGKDFLLTWNSSTTAPTAAPVNGLSAATAVADNNGAGGAICAFAATATPGTATVGLPVTFTTSLGVVSTGTAKTALAVTGTTGSVCTNYRGGGGIVATDTAIVSNSLSNVVDTLPISLTAPSGSTASKMVISQPNNSAVSASQTTTSPGYVSPTQQTNFGIQVQDSAGLGVGGQVVLITTDKGALVAGFNGAGCAGASSKAVTSTSALAAAPQALTVGGTAVTGGISVTYCGNQNDASGSATITVSNISTSMANQTTTIKTGGRPAKVEATYAAGVISATVNDANGNTVADGTPVQFTISANAGAVSNACTTTSNGQATSAVSLNTGSGSVIVTAGYNETGATAGGCSVVAAVAAGGNAGAVPVIGTTLGSAQSVSTVVNIGTVVTPPATVAPVAAPASGAGAFAAAPVYSAGKQASAVFNGGTLVQFQAAITAAGGTGAWAQDSKGNFVAHIVGGGPVNAAFAAAFPTGFAGVTAVTVIGK